ncbi:hypothetical protein C0584_02480 [Candidatus Parcubacteria bacterium]|nr:MAG: hypothetical protein C0584_02480 [Candidatus Parcubacteria bacterium]
MKAIIFDFDGVIHDTFKFHKQKIKEFSGLVLGDEEYRGFHKRNFLTEIPEKYKEIDWTKYSDFIFEDIQRLTISPIVKRAIISLGEIYDLYIVSSDGAKGIKKYLENNGVSSYFKEILGLKEARAKSDKFLYIFDEYDLEKEDCIFVTDTLSDVLEANEISLRTIAVDFGYHSRKTLSEGGPYKIISNFEELEELIK